jgi:hypothetical protein
MGRFVEGAPEAAQIGPPQIIHQEKYDIGSACPGAGAEQGTENQDA